MLLVRTILAFVIAAALALLPVGASAAGMVVPGDAHAGMQMGDESGMTSSQMSSSQMSSSQMSSNQMSSNHVSMDQMAMHHCCPDDMKDVPSHTDGYKCGMGLCCAGGMVALSDVRAVAFGRVPVVGNTIAIPADQVVSFLGGSPPFRPPRV